MAGEEDTKFLSLEEVEKHNIPNGEDKSIWIIIHEKVYDVTKFLDEVRKTSKCIVAELIRWGTGDFCEA